MSRRGAWKGTVPESDAAARRHLLAVAQDCIERHGFSKVTLSDVAAAAGVTRPTVYRHFGSAEELFNAAAVTASGGYLERVRARAMKREDPVDRIVEAIVISISEIPDDPYVMELFQMRDAVSVHAASEHAFVADELRRFVDGAWKGSEAELEEFAEILLRLVKSFLDDPGPDRSVADLRRFFTRWLVPMLRPQFL